MYQVFETEKRGDVLVLRFIKARIIHPEQVLCMDTELTAAADGAEANCCLDFSEVRYLSSYAVGALYRFWQRMKSRNKKLATHSVRHEVYNDLLAVGLSDKMVICEDQQRAFETLRGS